VLAENNSANDQQIKDLADPTDEQDAATKNYVDNTTYTQAEVDNLISGLQNQINDLQNPVNYDVTNNGSSAYTFDGGGFTNSSNPDLTLERGKTYTFTINASGHPFYINTVNATGTNNAYSSGVTNNGTQNGTITFTVPQDAPDTLYYNCQYHSTMNGTITITD
jgi:plastocyanin